MNRNALLGGAVFALLTLGLLGGGAALGDTFTARDVHRWMGEYKAVADQGRALFTDGKLGTNGVACAQCHPNAANTHPETYPKYQKQLGKVVPIREMINWCIQNPLEGEPLKLDDPRMIALEAYIAWERRGTKLAPGKH